MAFLFSYEGMSPYIVLITGERNTSNVISQHSLGCRRHPRRPLATRVVRRQYRPHYPHRTGYSRYCLIVQPLCGNAQKSIDQVGSYASPLLLGTDEI
jgi:hypothetical protein